jgi:hypothetical protein
MSRKAGTLLALAAVVAVGAAGYEVAHHSGGQSFAADAAASGSSTGVPVPPPATASPAPVTETTHASAPRVTTPPNPQSGQTLATDTRPVVTASTVRVVTTFHDWNVITHEVMVGGYVPGVIEDGGTCTLTLTSGSSTATGRTQAHADASTTTCGAVTVAGSRLAAGTWNAVLSYSSPEHRGAASPVTVQVPR